MNGRLHMMPDAASFSGTGRLPDRKKKKNQLTAAPGVLNAGRHNLNSDHNVTQRTGAPKTQERYIAGEFCS